MPKPLIGPTNRDAICMTGCALSTEVLRPLAHFERKRFAFSKLGRPRIDPAMEKRIQAQLRGGKGIRKIARECGVGTGTVQRVQQEMKGPFVGEAA